MKKKRESFSKFLPYYLFLFILLSCQNEGNTDLSPKEKFIRLDQYSSLISMELLEDETVILAGQRNSDRLIGLTKTDLFCNEIWNKSYFRINNGKVDLLQAQDGDLVFMGQYSNDIAISRVNTIGEEKWSVEFFDDIGLDLKSLSETSTNEILAIGNQLTDTGIDLTIIKIDSNGDVLWRKLLKEEHSSKGFDIIETREGDYLVSSIKLASPRHFIKLLKLNSDGEKVWENELQLLVTPSNNSLELIPTLDSGYVSIFTLLEGNTIFGTHSMGIMKINSTGELIWSKEIELGESSSGGRIIELENGDLVAFGNVTLQEDESNILIHKMNRTGNEIWTNTCQFEDGFIFEDVVEASFGYILCGISSGFDSWILKVDMEGNTI